MLVLNFEPFPEMQTQRLNLRRITSSDLEDLFRLRSNTEAMKYIDRPLATNISMVQELFANMDNNISTNTGLPWGIALKTNNKLIGTIGYYRIAHDHYRAEVGYMLEPGFWNKGIMSEALEMILPFGFNSMHLHSIEAVIDPDNMVSRKILLKHGFVKEACFKENHFSNGKFLDTEIFSLLAGGLPKKDK